MGVVAEGEGARMRRGWWGVVWLGACASAPAPRPGSGAPSTEAMDGALEAHEARARRCLAAGDRVRVEGFFDGPSGRYLVERVTAAAPSTTVRAQQCVSLAMERARVRPFANGRADAGWEVSSGAAPGAAVGAAAAAVIGEVDPAAVLALLRAEEPEARRCYEDALRGDARLRGRVEVRFTLSVDGRITHAVASGPRGFRAVGHCIVGHLRGLQWPAARGGSVDFVFPYRFAPRR
jgi:predicted kinase